jgi:hypothetical protein
MTAFMWNCKEMDKTIKGVVKPNQGQKEMEEEEKKLGKSWLERGTYKGKKRRNERCYIYFFLVLLEENVKVEAPCILNSSLDLEDKHFSCKTTAALYPTHVTWVPH